MAPFGKISIVLSIFFVSHIFAQGNPEDTLRAGSGGSAGGTQQSPVYDAGVTGPNGPMGAPDVTAVDPDGSAIRKTTPKKPVGTIRLDAAGNAPPAEVSPSPQQKDVK